MCNEEHVNIITQVFQKMLDIHAFTCMQEAQKHAQARGGPGGGNAMVGSNIIMWISGFRN